MLADPPPPWWPLSGSWGCAGASRDPALILHIMAWDGHNEAGVMGEEEALLQGLHFLELMTSLRAAGTVPLTLSGSSRAHHSPAGMQRGGADGKGASGPSGGAARRWKPEETSQCLQAPIVVLSSSLPFSLRHPLQGGGGAYRTKIQSFIHSSNIILFYSWGDRNAFHSFIQL